MSNSFTPINPLFTGTCTVKGSSRAAGGTSYRVNLTEGFCTCAAGSPWVEGSDGSPIPRAYCSHKLQALWDVTRRNGHFPLLADYLKALSTRYPLYWEVASAFHKELRRGDPEAAYFWALLLTRFRGFSAPVRYMVNVLFEETRDVSLLGFLLDSLIQLSGKVRSPQKDYCLLYECILLFCRSRKKWEQPHRYDIFCTEMRGYAALAEDFSYKVSQARDILPPTAYAGLRESLLEGFKERDALKVQYGLKGLLKSQPKKGLRDHAAHILALFELLETIFSRGPALNAFSYDPGYAEAVRGIIRRRYSLLKAIGYHEINAFADALMGEIPEAAPPVCERRKEYILVEDDYRLPSGAYRRVPLYAHDNHTAQGKSLMSRFAGELAPGAVQLHLDFRYCGAYYGVSWRHLAIKQGDCITCEWGLVRWPAWLSKITKKLFY
jgi:hypothetical protein